jgi:hypothetical protein
MDLIEGNLKLNLDGDLIGFKFDDKHLHGLSYCMKAVDFIVRSNEEEFYYFIEFKDPDNPKAHGKDIRKFMKEFIAGKKDDELVKKFRDTFLYQYGMNCLDLPIRYCVLVASKALDNALLLTRTDDLKRKLPVSKPLEVWEKEIASDCIVLNIESWNRHFSDMQVERIV